MAFRLFYPDFKEKALTFSYDDGQAYDRELVRMFRAYGLKGTFHLNSGRLGQEGFVTAQELPTLYEGQEIACHGVEHACLFHLGKEQLVREFFGDRLALEGHTGRIIRGCSYAYGDVNEEIVQTLRTLGFAYSRTVQSTGGFQAPADFMRWTPTCHHNDAFGKLSDDFLHGTHHRGLPLFYIWGHSFEFAREDSWGKMEALCKKLSGQEDVWYTTNIDYANYVKAARELQFSADGRRVQNLSAIPIYAEVDGERVRL